MLPKKHLSGSQKRKKRKQDELLKNYLRSTMLQGRLNGLAMCSIENAILGIIDLDTIINDFASRNAHRSFFAKD